MKGTVEFYHLRSFVAVAEEENLTKAASRLYTTPPAISAHIKALEEELDTVLFIRSSKGMKLTPQGELLLAKARTTLDSALDMMQSAQQQQQNITGTIKLGINQPASSLLVSALHSNLQQLSAGLSLSVMEMPSQQVIKGIDQLTLDVGYFYGELPKGFCGLLVKQQEITTIVPVDCQSNVSDLPWIYAGQDCPFEINNPLAGGKGKRMHVTSDLSRIDFVKEGLGASFIEANIAQEFSALGQVKIEPEFNFSLNLWIGCLQARRNEPLISALWQTLTPMLGDS